MNHHRVIYLLVLAALACAVGASHATEIVPMDPVQLGARSSSVVLGTVADVRSFWNADRTKIFTEVVLDVAATYKGGERGQVRLIQLGGEVDGVRVSVHGALHWERGEEVLLFLEPNRGGAFHVTGFSQGKFRVERDERTGRAYVSRPALEDVAFTGGGATKAQAGSPVERVPLDSFVSRALGRTEAAAER